MAQTSEFYNPFVQMLVMAREHITSKRAENYGLQAQIEDLQRSKTQNDQDIQASELEEEHAMRQMNRMYFELTGKPIGGQQAASPTTEAGQMVPEEDDNGEDTESAVDGPAPKRQRVGTPTEIAPASETRDEIRVSSVYDSPDTDSGQLYTEYDIYDSHERFPHVVMTFTGWLELQCPCCRGNVKANGAFVAGLEGLRRHISRAHKDDPAIKEIGKLTNATLLELAKFRRIANPDCLVSTYDATIHNPRVTVRRKFEQCSRNSDVPSPAPSLNPPSSSVDEAPPLFSNFQPSLATESTNMALSHELEHSTPSTPQNDARPTSQMEPQYHSQTQVAASTAPMSQTPSRIVTLKTAPVGEAKMW